MNKLGDSLKRIQTHTIYQLLKITSARKEYSETIIREVTLFINRQGVKTSHIYYATAYLNRVASFIAPKDEKVRMMLFKIYFSMFRKILN